MISQIYTGSLGTTEAGYVWHKTPLVQDGHLCLDWSVLDRFLGHDAIPAYIQTQYETFKDQKPTWFQKAIFATHPVTGETFQLGYLSTQMTECALSFLFPMGASYVS